VCVWYLQKPAPFVPIRRDRIQQRQMRWTRYLDISLRSWYLDISWFSPQCLVQKKLIYWKCQIQSCPTESSSLAWYKKNIAKLALQELTRWYVERIQNYPLIFLQTPRSRLSMVTSIQFLLVKMPTWLLLTNIFHTTGAPHRVNLRLETPFGTVVPSVFLGFMCLKASGLCVILSVN